MAAQNETTDYKKIEDSIARSEVLRGVISDEIKTAAKKNSEVAAGLKATDPYGVHEVFDTLKTEKTPEGRDYQQALSMAHRVNDWLRSNGTFWSDKAQKAVKMTFQDAVHSKDMQFLFPKVVSSIVIEHMEPQSNILGLYEKIRFQNGTSITFPVWSAGGSSINLFMGEEGEPNELTGDLSSFVTASTGKVGIKASISEDTMRYSVIDLYALQIKWCGIALGRFKERLAVDNLFNAASSQVLFDNNLASTATPLGNTRGCNSAGQYNGTLSSYDLFDVYAHGLAQGQDLNTIIIHPLGWRALANNSVLRDRAYWNGGKIWEGPTGSDGRREIGKGLQKMFNPGYQTKQVGAKDLATQATTTSGTIQVLGQPFNVIVSPFAPIRKLSQPATLAGSGATIKTGTYVCDILMIDPRDVGYLIVDQELYTREEERLFQQIKETAFIERYGFGTANLRVGLYCLKNIVCSEGYDFLASPVTITTGGLTAWGAIANGQTGIGVGNLG